MRRTVAILLIMACALTGCSGEETANRVEPGGSSSSRSAQQGEAAQPETENENALPARYTVPEGWVKVEEHSTEEKIFYAQEGYDADGQPDNISINVGSNRYSAEEHESFREAIIRQLMAQVSGADAELYGDGANTEQGYPVYIFTIEDGDTVTKQYYIVGDYQYGLIHLTNYTGSEAANEAARAMADSFVWDDDE